MGRCRADRLRQRGDRELFHHPLEHHLAFGNTCTNGSLAAATPSSRGLEPVAAFDHDGRTNAPMADELAAFTAVLAALDDEQLADAAVSTSDLVLGPGPWAGLGVSEHPRGNSRRRHDRRTEATGLCWLYCPGTT